MTNLKTIRNPDYIQALAEAADKGGVLVPVWQVRHVTAGGETIYFVDSEDHACSRALNIFGMSNGEGLVEVRKCLYPAIGAGSRLTYPNDLPVAKGCVYALQGKGAVV